MSTAARFPADTLSALVNAETQRLAARLAQDVFSEIFRKAFTPDPEQLGKALLALETQCVKWYQAGESDECRVLRLALLITGLDQWGLAYAQTFDLAAMPPLTAMIGALRSRLNAQSDALFAGYFQQIEQVETDAVDFKVELRRSIHVALWHAMVACETLKEAEAILKHLGGMLLALNERMPELGWRLVADALGHIQISLLSEAASLSDVARESTQQLFGALHQALPAERYQVILQQAGQVVLAWQQVRRANEA